MHDRSRTLVVALAFATSWTACGGQQGEAPAGQETAAAEDAEKAALIADALSAATPSLAAVAKVADWEGNVLKEGAGPYTCLPTPPQWPAGTSPMCMDEPWMAWADAWSNKKEFTPDRIGISYMLAGDAGSSNVDPYATEATEDNQWVVEGPHLMIITPDTALLDSLPTDPENGGPYVMWKGTPYAHVMVPIDIAEPEGVDGAVADALSAASAGMMAGAKVVDWEGNTLREGTGPYTCLPTPPQLSDARAPMCMDGPWMAWADGWANREGFSIDSLGVSYMLAGDGGASNVDPFATEPTDDNEWVVEGPHLMIIVPDAAAALAALPTDPKNGGPYVMWRGTPYAHVMVPVAD